VRALVRMLPAPHWIRTSPS